MMLITITACFVFPDCCICFCWFRDISKTPYSSHALLLSEEKWLKWDVSVDGNASEIGGTWNNALLMNYISMSNPSGSKEKAILLLF